MTKSLRLATIIILSIIVCISKASASSLDEFVSARAQAIKQHWLPPKGNEGYSVAVNFRVHRDGSVSDFQVVQQHNRIQIVVDAARAAIVNAAPRPLPAGAPESILIQAHFRYDFSNTSPWLFLIDEEKHTAALILTEDQKVAMKTSSEQIAGLQPYMAEVAARCKKVRLPNPIPAEGKTIDFWIQPNGKAYSYNSSYFGRVPIDWLGQAKKDDAEPFPPLPAGYATSIGMQLRFKPGQDPEVSLPATSLRQTIPPEPILGAEANKGTAQ